MQMKSIGEYLKKYGIKPSYQRMKIYEYLVKYKNHPTVDTIYQSLGREIVTLSKTTVYNTLSLFTKKNVVKEFNINENESRYDANTSLHGHFKCEKCNKVCDFALKKSAMNVQKLKNFQIMDMQILFKGKCEKCIIKK